MRRPAMVGSKNFKFALPSDAELEKMFAAVPALERLDVSKKAVSKGGYVIRARARDLAPRRKNDGFKWTAAMYQPRPGKPARSPNEEPLWKTIAMRSVRYENGRAIAIVGPKWPQGNKWHFMGWEKGGKEIVVYGRRTGRFRPFTRQDDFIKRAFDETRAEQLQAMKDSLRASMKELWEKGM